MPQILLWPTAANEVSAYSVADLAKTVGLSEEVFLQICRDNDEFLEDTVKITDPIDREHGPTGGSEDVCYHNLQLKYPDAVTNLETV
jgi:hypothetical protein